MSRTHHRRTIRKRTRPRRTRRRGGGTPSKSIAQKIGAHFKKHGKNYGIATGVLATTLLGTNYAYNKLKKKLTSRGSTTEEPSDDIEENPTWRDVDGEVNEFDKTMFNIDVDGISDTVGKFSTNGNFRDNNTRKTHPQNNSSTWKTVRTNNFTLKKARPNSSTWRKTKSNNSIWKEVGHSKYEKVNP